MENKSVISTFVSILVLVVLALFVIKYFNISYPVAVTTSQRSNELSVVGEGKVEAVPDTASIQVGITVNNKETAAAAQKEIATINNRIIEAMGKLGIPKKNISTTSYSVYPNYSYENNQNLINGYNGNASVRIKTDNVSLASQVVETATSVGANEIHGTTFEINKPEKYREEARNKAIENAKEQAEKLARSLGIRLGKIVNIVESVPGNGPIVYDQMRAEGYGGGGAPAFEPGTQTITSTVTLYFEKR